MTDTIDALLRYRAEHTPDRTAVVDPDARIDYRALHSDSRSIAARLIDMGVGKGTRVGLVMPNGTDWVRFAMALTRIGAVLVPLSTLLAPRELVAQLATAAVRALVTVDEFRGRRYADDLATELAAAVTGRTLLHSRLPALRHVWAPDEVAGTAPSDDALRIVDAMAGAVTPSDPLAIVFTSGSSGAPKGVVHSHGSALGAVASSLEPRCIAADTRLYLPMPFFWVGGFGSGVLSALVAGATLVTEPTPRPETTLQLLERERVTLFRGWPDQAEAVARHARSFDVDLSSLQPGSLDALLPAELRGRPGARARLFGMTESFGPYCGYRADTDMPESAWGSCGTPFDGMEVRIVDVENGSATAPGTIGEIQIRGPHTLRGVCGRSREDLFTTDGFYPTGDLGHLDDDGFLFYHGRSDDMFKVSGATVYPSEVESALRTLPGVVAAFVTNVAAGGSNRVGAAIVRDEVCDEACDDATLRHAARKVLSAFKVPTVWLRLASDDQVPRGTTGKVDVPRLRDMLAEADRMVLTSAPTPIVYEGKRTVVEQTPEGNDT
ncbi:class I adenylate-forming enzyme family protein [Mycolicibacterium sp. GCM10028919]|uniref:class I adenylate-forming enzyme family protein n=1 Tax=Mycolicibacterium sp. GCM10028919 TaxID=3273401 RepID=UPI00360BF7E9